jgi:hypothetical protein
MKENHLDPKQLALRWNVSSLTLKKWRWNGKGPDFLKLNKKIVYPIEDVIEFEIARKNTSTSSYKNK